MHGKVRGLLTQELLAHESFDDQLVGELLISTRDGVNHLLYDEVLDLIWTI
jgi:hypothetical protein